MIIADTGLWVALVDRGDRYHVACCEFIRHNRFLVGRGQIRHPFIT